ncbi:MAG: hypothetical protein A3J54_00255 [Candidatus Ryanbacteria bacterium RIFCSPHIGHO2_02_FULL_45_13b]|uniref:PD-(D/E)XK endonuclease-like domain-containing protein n=1 Tax=Candidatus Ryanbacteria bacterium RIFCSPHIGHO2_02_FULL_45_13b TaxID=1802117 RepID=A0A1G2G9K0_9BACT|nr:MAG: hypothetical protein A3J54_00255 [Candidatus Ryanbacteria bacterium RIFCSPHIGHO2_02_FULL_45_13b]
MRTSYSALETFRQCPQKYKFQEIDKIKTPKSKEAVFGTLIHASLKFLFSRDPLYPSLDEVIENFRNSWRASDIVNLSEDERSLYLTQGENILRRFYAKNQPWNFNVVDMESRFELSITDPKTNTAHTIAGIMDRVDKPTDETFEIIDYKTSRKMKSQESVDDDLQLSLYHLGLLRRWPHIQAHNVVLSLYYVKHNEKITTSRKKEDTERIEQHILTTIRDIETRTVQNDFPPQPSALCDWCGHKAMCPAWKFMFRKPETENLTQENIEKNIKEYFTLKKTDQEITKRLLELQADIKIYMKQEGLTRLFDDMGTISKTVQERFSYDYEKIHFALEAHNRLDIWNALLKPDDKQLKAIITSLPSPLREQILETRTATKKFEVLTTTMKKAIAE